MLRLLWYSAPMENLKPASKINDATLKSDSRQRFIDALMHRGTISAILCLLLAAVWLPLLTRSFWVDEANTFWLAHEGASRAVQKTLHLPGQSVLYSAIASLFCFDGSPFRDALLRLPSLIGIAVAAWFLYRLAEKNIARGAGIVAIILFLFHPDVVFVGAQARSYALAIGAVVASCWALCEWVETRSRIYLLWYVLASTLVIYLHYFFVAIFGVQVLYLLFVLLIDRRPSRWIEISCAGAVIIILALPLIPHLKLLLSESHTLSFVGPPRLKDLTDYIVPSVLVAGLLIVGYLLPLFDPNLLRRDINLKSAFLFFITTWWLLGPMLFFAVSKLTPLRVLVPRYLAFSLPAQALLFAYIGMRLFGSAGARVWALAAVLLFAANPLFLSFGRNAAHELLPLIRLIRSEPNAPVFFPSLLVESQFHDWRAGNQPDSYFFAPLVAYPIPNKLLPLPYEPTDDVKKYVSDEIDSQLAGVPEVLFVAAGDRWEDFTADWLVDRMRLAGFHGNVRRTVGFTVLIFTR
jgi:hypothetical protein